MGVILDEFNVVQPDIFVVCNEHITSDFVDVVIYCFLVFLSAMLSCTISLTNIVEKVLLQLSLSLNNSSD